MSDEELTLLFSGYGYNPFFIEGHDPEPMHQLMADASTRSSKRSHNENEARHNRHRNFQSWSDWCIAHSEAELGDSAGRGHLAWGPRS